MAEYNCKISGVFRHFVFNSVSGIKPETMSETDLEDILKKSQALNSGILVKDSKGTTAALFTLDSGEKVFIKQYNAYNFKRRFRQLFSTPRPLRVFKATSFLERLGVWVPPLLLASPIKRGGFGIKHLVVNRALPAPLTVAEHIDFVLDSHNFPKFCAELIALVEKLHASGFKHGDLKMQNILLKRNGNDFELGVFDFDGSATYSVPVTGKRQAKEYARIITSLVKVAKDHGYELTIDEAKKELLSSATTQPDCHYLSKYIKKISGHRNRYPQK